MTNRDLYFHIINSYNNLFLFRKYINDLVYSRKFYCIFLGGVIYEG